MAAGDTTPGRRVPESTKPWDLEPGDYQVLKVLHGVVARVCLPNGVGPSKLEGWSVEEHEDQTISVTPSIHDAPDGWHGYLTNGMWHEV